jgi:hypothetical protein
VIEAGRRQAVVEACELPGEMILQIAAQSARIIALFPSARG